MANKAEAPMSGGEVKDPALADQGKRRTEWAFHSMPVLQNIRKQFIKTQPLAGIRIAACLHLTTETANLLITLRDGGASSVVCSSNPRSIQDDAAATLVRDYHIPVFAVRGAAPEVQEAHRTAVLDSQPHLILDDGGELLQVVHTRRRELLENVVGATEETASGLARARVLAREGALAYPVLALSEAATRLMADNRFGTGQSIIDGILRATNVMLAGCQFVVAGYGRCGRAIAQRARGMGASVIVTEVDPMKAVDALLEGFRVMSMPEAAALGDVFVTAGGNRSVISRDHFERMKTGAIVCNAGHSSVEIDLEGLGKLASSRRQIREAVEEFGLRDGRRVYVLAEGRLVNLTAAEGHPAAVMDLSFAHQALAVEYLVKSTGSLENKVCPVPPELDRMVARIKLESMGVKIDRLTLEQEQYLANRPETS